MPSSSHHQVSQILEWIIQLRPASVLDVGVGTGKYGFLCREALDTPLASEPRRLTLHGIEGFESYIGDIQRLVYDEIMIGDCLEVLAGRNQSYDLALLIDVIEHLEKPDALVLLKRLLETSRNLIIATPYGFAPQDDIFGNSLEIHRSGWVKKDFEGYPDRIAVKIEHKLLCVIGKDVPTLRKAVRKGKLLRIMQQNRVVQLGFAAAKAVGLTDVGLVRKKLGF